MSKADFEASCLDGILAMANGDNLGSVFEATVTAQLEAARTIESNLITSVFECQVPGCDRHRAANYSGEELVVDPGGTSGECLRKFGSSLILTASQE